MRNITVMGHGVESVHISVDLDPEISEHPIVHIAVNGQDNISFFCTDEPTITFEDKR